MDEPKLEYYLNKVKNPSNITNLSISELIQLSSLLRKRIINIISITGGHLASSLGTIELTLALYKAFDINKNTIIWDIGHQCYSHKILTGRNDKFEQIGKLGGISKFLERSESKYDHFGGGHASTSISAAIGFKIAYDLQNINQIDKTNKNIKYNLTEDNKIIAVIGDGAMSCGLAYEAVNLAGYLKKNIMVVLNDNQMSIGKNIGVMTKAFNLIQQNEIYNYIRKEFKNLTDKKLFPKSLLELLKRFDHSFMQFLSPQAWFESLGIRYFGPIDGHNIKTTVEMLKKIKNIGEPVIIHVKTVKGKGYKPAEDDSLAYHGASSFERSSGKFIASKKNITSYSKVFGTCMEHIVEKDKNIIIICAAMLESYNLQNIKKKHPTRVIDVGIAESNAVCMAAGIAASGLTPFVTIYSTFLQRAFDQLIHDVALQNLAVKFIIDRGGLVGFDGATHNGVFDISYLRLIPNMVILSPRDVYEFVAMINFCYKYNSGPIAIRYPRGDAPSINNIEELMNNKQKINLGKGELIEKGRDGLIISIGVSFQIARELSNLLKKQNIDVSIFDAKFAKPIDEKSIIDLAKKSPWIITIEENSKIGGFGSAVNDLLVSNKIWKPIMNFGIEDKFTPYRSVLEQRDFNGLNAKSMLNEIQFKFLNNEK